jgi:hypothetical protein
MQEAKSIWWVPLALGGVVLWLAALGNPGAAEPPADSERDAGPVGEGFCPAAWRDGWSN